jgi:L-fuconolactonase
MLPDDRDFGPAMARLTQRQRIFVDVCSAASSRLRRRVEPATSCKGACSYPVLFNAFKRLASGTSTAEKADLFAGTASRFYRLAN